MRGAGACLSFLKSVLGFRQKSGKKKPKFLGSLAGPKAAFSASQRQALRQELPKRWDRHGRSVAPCTLDHGHHHPHISTPASPTQQCTPSGFPPPPAKPHCNQRLSECQCSKRPQRLSQCQPFKVQNLYHVPGPQYLRTHVFILVYKINY